MSCLSCLHSPLRAVAWRCWLQLLWLNCLVPREMVAFPPILSTEPANSGLLNIPGFASVPTELIRRIWGLEYIDMWELLPETWRQETAQSSACCHSRRPKRGLITDIALWTECPHHTGSSTTCISTLSRPSSPPHGIHLDDSKGQLKF